MADGTGLLFDAGSSYTPSGSIRLYANWIDNDTPIVEITFTVSFNANGGNGTPPVALTVNAGSSITFPNGNGLAKSNALFGGWSADADSTGTIYQPGDSYTPAGHITFYTVWISTYTVIFNVNGGNGTPPLAQTVTASSVITLPDGSGLSKTGYTFGGWYREATLINQWDFDADTVTGDITLYAKWDPITYMITYDKNAVDATGTMTNSSHTYDVDKNLNANAFTRTGYTFTGWARTASGAVEFTDSHSVKNLSAVAEGTVTLYAQWNPITYTVAYNKNAADADGTMTNSSHTYDAEKALNANAFTRTGYTFFGWARTVGGEVEFNNGQSVKNLAAVAGTTVTLYAQWVDSSTVWTVRFETYGGSNVGDAVILRNTPVGRPTPDPSRTGYTFDNWFADEELTTMYNFSSVVTGNITLYAKWDMLGSGVINVPFTGPTEKNISITRVITNNLSKSGGGSITLTINENFDRYEWFVGTTNVASGNNVTLQADNAVFIPGHNWITAVVYTGTGANAIPWSGEFVIYVSE